MEKYLEKQIDSLIQRYPSLKVCKESIQEMFYIIKNCFASGNKLLIAGNGGSCSDAEHIAGELMKGFKLSRKCSLELAQAIEKIDKNRGTFISNAIQQGLPTIVLSNHSSLNTAFINDVPNGGNFVYAQQVLCFGKKGDVFLGISTSGNSENIISASIVAKALGLKVLALTGLSGGELNKFADSIIRVPSSETYMIQELHLPIYHCLCSMLESFFFDENNI